MGCRSGSSLDARIPVEKEVDMAKENMIQFCTIDADGIVTDTRRIKQADLLACHYFIIDSSHYREDGSCKCDDAAERARMIREWGYKKRHFRNIPLRGEVI